MALSTSEQTELDQLVDARRKAGAKVDRAELEYKQASLAIVEFLAEHRLKAATSRDGHRAEIVQTVDWRHIDRELVEADFPRDEYPHIYTPDYRALKDAANERVGAKNPESTAAVSKYTGFTSQLRVRKQTKRTWRKR